MSEEVVVPGVKITVRTNGSLRVEGPVELVDGNGVAFDLTDKPAFSLCRCGLSAVKPFCDGSHKREGWCDANPTPVEPSAAS